MRSFGLRRGSRLCAVHLCVPLDEQRALRRRSRVRLPRGVLTYSIWPRGSHALMDPAPYVPARCVPPNNWRWLNRAASRSGDERDPPSEAIPLMKEAMPWTPLGSRA